MLTPVTDTVWMDQESDRPAFDPVFKTPSHFDLANLYGFTSGQPFDYYRTLRENAPVAWVDMPGSAGFWAVTRYEDVKAIELDPDTFSSQEGGINIGYGKPAQRKGRLYGAALNTLICLDRPAHIPLRMQHRSFFTPDYVAKLRKKVEIKVDALLDDLEANGPVVDMVEHFSTQLPLFTLSEMLGIEEKDRPKIIRWMNTLERLTQAANEQRLGKINPLYIIKATYNLQEMFRFGERILKDRRANPRDDLLSAIAAAEVDGEPLSQDFLDGAWLLIIFAGNDTTRNSLSGTMRLLSQFPDIKKRLIEDPKLISALVPEALRMVSPVMHMRRTTTNETQIGNQKLGRHEKVVLFYGAANRDPSVFHDPDRMDLNRTNANDHLAFGLGPHVCLGQRIASMQIEVAYEKMLERFPNVEWTGKQEILPGNFVHTIAELEINLGS
jgi:cytochrome P450